MFNCKSFKLSKFDSEHVWVSWQNCSVFDTFGSIPNIPNAIKTIKFVCNCQWSEIVYKNQKRIKFDTRKFLIKTSTGF